MTEIIFLAVALSMDAFAVSLTIGISNPKKIRQLALTAGVYFGIAQGIMPLFGYLGGVVIFGWLGNLTHWIAFVLLLIIGLKIIYDAVTSEPKDEVMSKTYSHYAFLILAIATSIDALAAGFSLPLMSVNGVHACFIIAITTFLFSYAGVTMGRRTSHWLGNKAEIFGGLVLIALGFKILLA